MDWLLIGKIVLLIGITIGTLKLIMLSEKINKK